MNTPHTPGSSSHPSKLVIRSEVLAVVQHLVSMADAPKNERLKQLKRLQDIQPQEPVLDVLVKELQRSGSTQTMQVVMQLLMELGNIEYLQDKLWAVIQDPKVPDEIKDASNLVLRHLGDTTDPDLYLEYLQDPQGLIGRETIRMLEVSTENPEALIDFIDFILSLEAPDQARLLGTLQHDYPSEYLVNIYIPLLLSDPSPELWEQLVQNLGETRSAKAAQILSRLSLWSEDRLPIPERLISKALKQLQLAGVYQPGEEDAEHPAEEPHSLAKETLPFQCFLTISDGIGNQGLLFSRQRANGDITMMCVALNDVHGLIDCFGFYQVSTGDFFKIVDKFHEGATKIKVSPEFAAYKLGLAESRNFANAFRLPYEYWCWQPMMSDILPQPPEDLEQFDQWVRKDWLEETDNLYQHPDFTSWFLEQGDDPVVTKVLQEVVTKTQLYLAADGDQEEAGYFQDLEQLADAMMLELYTTDWRPLMMYRLSEAAYLLHCQNTHTFRNLAATEAYKLQSETDPQKALTGFVRAFGRRCVGEELLRLRASSAKVEGLSELVDAVLAHWEI